jgi:putative Holliday junction resolvase
MTAQPLSTIERKSRQGDLEAISDYVRSYSIEKIVVGYPVRLDGTRGVQCEKVDRFIERLTSAFPLPVCEWDETLSTREADEVLSEARIRRKDRKKIVDKIAAAIMLQSYLDSMRKKL